MTLASEPTRPEPRKQATFDDLRGFIAEVEAEGETRVEYRVRVRWC